jgi:hypothetical protein
VPHPSTSALLSRDGCGIDDSRSSYGERLGRLEASSYLRHGHLWELLPGIFRGGISDRNVSDMNGTNVGSQRSLPLGSGEAITALVTVANTGGTTFSAGAGSSFTAYGWIERANVT